MVREIANENTTINSVRRLISSAKICMVTTSILDWELTSQPVNHQWVDTDGVIWFLYIRTNISTSFFSSGKMDAFYANAGRSEFLSISGVAEIGMRNEIPHHQSFPFLKTLSNDALGPTLGILKFFPEDGYIWQEDLQCMVPFVWK
jgi:general stress protein 26